MTPTFLRDLAVIVSGELHDDSPALVSGFATDSREAGPGDLFLAIKGVKVDGHDFDEQVLAKGVTGILAERPVMGPHILVPNLVQALGKLGSYYRDQFAGPVIGITGSAGKTTTKEFLAAALSPLGEILKTEGNRNTEYTAPLLWPEVTPETQAVVVEMAMRGLGQIAHLASFSKPTVGVVTNIGWSHASEVGSREGIAEAKSELLSALPGDGVAVLPIEDEFFGILAKAAGNRQIYTFGSTEAADCRVIGIQSEGWEGSTINGFFADIPWQAHIPYLGKHFAQNVAAAICTAAALGLAPQEAAEALGDAEIPPMRMQVLEKDGVKILLDAYNASPASMRGAIETFMSLPVSGKRVAILGQMNELGDESDRAHRELGEYMKTLDLAALVFGPLSAGYGLGAPVESISDLKSQISDLKEGDAILIKGSRSLELEKVLA
ncbi:MAG: UDP-N-acetylmuramoyl-tripeptide--D-alanyl-D-alanine ligase [Chlorobia bacterium]|nr:UDP-N-acetylmuramoyl-tripeptide--D-alanyl-D-alanine ligase [Fimbriimonadaceae bacterium]